MDKLNIQTFNNISVRGLDKFSREWYDVASSVSNPDAIILRSYNMHDMEIPASLLAVGRAGAGVNNIPLDTMSELGIPVFNAPGANANAVKELVVASMLLACRNICQAWDYTRNLQGDDAEISKAVEQGKKQFAGSELPGKTLGVIGLGAVGVRVANAARALGMNVVGYDPTITVERAWELSAEVSSSNSVSEVFNQADFVSFHVPLLDSTRNLINQRRLSEMKKGVVIINLARNGIVDDQAVLEALEGGKVSTYITDFPNNLIKDHPNVITLPHLGASTAEAEENCAIMVANQLCDYLEHGIVQNSVNFPEVSLPRVGVARITIAHQNKPAMLGQISNQLGSSGKNISHLINESKGSIAYTVVDLDNGAGENCCGHLRDIDGVLKVRVL